MLCESLTLAGDVEKGAGCAWLRSVLNGPEVQIALHATKTLLTKVKSTSVRLCRMLVRVKV